MRRRSTINPGLRRSSVSITPRTSVYGDSDKRRDIRKIRDPSYKQRCVDNVYEFLVSNNYDMSISKKVLFGPSVRDFQSIFKFIYSFIDRFDYSQRFEDDLMLILKGIKYPYSNEITRSQLIALTPHTWPAVLSMLSWFINLIKRSKVSEAKRSIESMFQDFVASGYLRFMQGEADDDVESEFYANVNSFNKERVAENDKLNLKIQELEIKIKNSEGNHKELDDLKERKQEILNEMDELVQKRTQIEEKNKRYTEDIEKLRSELQVIINEKKVLMKELGELRKQMDSQIMKPDEVRVLNSEKIELFKELERMKPEKERIHKTISDAERTFISKTDELERLVGGFINMVKNNKARIFRDLGKEEVDELSGRLLEYRVSRDDDPSKAEVVGDTDAISSAVDDLISRATSSGIRIAQEKMSKEEKMMEKQSLLSDIEDKFSFDQNRFNNLGMLYLDQKERIRIDERNRKKEMEGIKNQMIRMSIESNNILISSEQKLQKAKMEFDSIQSEVALEKEEVIRLISMFKSKLNVKIREMNEILKEIDAICA